MTLLCKPSGYYIYLRNVIINIIHLMNYNNICTNTYLELLKARQSGSPDAP